MGVTSKSTLWKLLAFQRNVVVLEMWSLEEADINGGFAVALTIKTYTEIQLAIIFMHTEDG